VIEQLVTALGESAKIVLPDVQVSGDDPVLPSVYWRGALAAASVGRASCASISVGPARETARVN
jgi:hypothetical protein